jgi:hypothetical protein
VKTCLISLKFTIASKDWTEYMPEELNWLYNNIFLPTKLDARGYLNHLFSLGQNTPIHRPPESELKVHPTPSLVSRLLTSTLWMRRTKLTGPRLSSTYFCTVDGQAHRARPSKRPSDVHGPFFTFVPTGSVFLDRKITKIVRRFKNW